MKTALQEFMEWIETNDNSYNALFAYQKAEELLDTEMEQMRHAFLCGDDAVFQFGREKDFTSFNEYYKETYNK